MSYDHVFFLFIRTATSRIWLGLTVVEGRIVCREIPWRMGGRFRSFKNVYLSHIVHTDIRAGMRLARIFNPVHSDNIIII